jgi:DNA-binding FadR family transcriptional regulator
MRPPALTPGDRPPRPASASTPGVARALAYLQGLIQDPAWQARGQLPGVRALARLSGFSHFTLWKALRLAAGSGLVLVEPGRRPRLRGDPPGAPPGPPESALRKWERLGLQIERDLLHGTFLPGEALPSLKEMRGKYRVSHATLRKALGGLERSGVWPPASDRGRTRGSGHYVVYLAWGDERGNQYFDEPFDHDYLKALRSACERLNLEPAVAVYGYRGGGPGLRLVMPPGATLTFAALCEMASGFLVRTACPHDVCADLLPLLARHRKPIAVLDEVDSPSLPEWTRRSRLVKAFRPTISESSGELMAAHLLALGHRRLAAISPFRDAVWSRNRMAGMAAALGRADPEASIAEYTLDMPYQQRHAVRENRGFGLLRRSLLRTPGWQAPLPGLAGVVSQLAGEIHLALRRERILEALTPLLEKALKRQDVTAWVAIDDDTALLVMEFLRRRGLHVPDDISLVGFDDTAEGARRDLTSYNFDFERFNHYLLRYLLDPARVGRAEAHGARGPAGRVVARGSVRPRKRPGDGRMGWFLQ